jgi:serine/threonine protein kinase
MDFSTTFNVPSVPVRTATQSDQSSGTNFCGLFNCLPRRRSRSNQNQATRPSPPSSTQRTRTAVLEKRVIGSQSQYTLNGVDLFGRYARADGSKPQASRFERRFDAGTQASVYSRNNPNSPVLVKKVKFAFEQSADTLDRAALLLAQTPRRDMARHFAIEVRHNKTKDGQPAVLTRKVEGPTLHGYMRRGRASPIDHSRMQRQLVQLRKAVAWLNEHGFEHRDIHAKNIIVEQDTGRLVLIDFGMVTDRGAGNAKDSFNSLDEFLAIHGITPPSAGETEAAELAQ